MSKWIFGMNGSLELLQCLLLFGIQQELGSEKQRSACVAEVVPKGLKERKKENANTRKTNTREGFEPLTCIPNLISTAQQPDLLLDHGSICLDPGYSYLTILMLMSGFCLWGLARFFPIPPKIQKMSRFRIHLVYCTISIELNTHLMCDNKIPLNI
jgi:hypothetical protein